MRQPLLGNGVAQRPNHVILPQHVVERLGAIFAGKNLITHAATYRARPQRSHQKMRTLLRLATSSPPQGTRGNFEKSGLRFSMKACLPSFASSLM